MAKLSAIKIYMHRVEGRSEDIQTVILSRDKRPDLWGAATAILRRWAVTAPDDQAGHRVDFEVTFEDGTLYKGAAQLTRRDMEDADLSQMCLYSIWYFAGKYLPFQCSREDYIQHLASHEDSHLAAIEILERCDFGAEFIPPTTNFLSLLDTAPVDVIPQEAPTYQDGPNCYDIVDVSTTASVAGFTLPVVMTTDVWELILKASGAPIEERLREVLQVARVAVQQCDPVTDVPVPFVVMLSVGNGPKMSIPFRVGPGENERGKLIAIMSGEG